MHFVSSENDRVDLSELAAPLANGLTFTGQNPAAYSVFYTDGFDTDLFPFIKYMDESCFEDSITLEADLDGNVENGAEFSVILLDISDITASDLILS